MWLNQLFGDNPIDFEKRCRMRVKTGGAVVILGILSGVLGFFMDSTDFIPEFYRWFGIGLAAGGLANIYKNVRYLKDPDLRKKREVAETDERNRLLGLRCWAYGGYTMFLALYVGIMVSGFISATVAKTLLAVGAVYGFLLLVFRRVLGKMM